MYSLDLVEFEVSDKIEVSALAEQSRASVVASRAPVRDPVRLGCPFVLYYLAMVSVAGHPDVIVLGSEMAGSEKAEPKWNKGSIAVASQKNGIRIG